MSCLFYLGLAYEDGLVLKHVARRNNGMGGDGSCSGIGFDNNKKSDGCVVVPSATSPEPRILIENSSSSFIVAGYVWVIYDWLITLDQEFSLVWFRPGGWKSKALYAFTRYYGLALLTFDLIVTMNSWTPEFCHAYFFVLGGGGFGLLFAVEGALQLRVYVMYHCSLKLLLINGALFFIEMALMVSFFMIDTLNSHSIAVPKELKGCWSLSLSGGARYTKAMWFVCLAFESYLTALVLRVAWSSWKTRSWGILSVLVRDSLIWFLLLTVCLGWNAVAWLLGKPGLLLTGVPGLHAGATIGGSRLLLNLRAAYYENSVKGMSTTPVNDWGIPTEGTVGVFRRESWKEVRHAWTPEGSIGGSGA